MQTDYIQTCSFKIEDLFYIPCGNYNPVYIRPYEFNVDGETLNTLSGILDENKTTIIPKNIMSNFANGFIQNSAVAFPSSIDNNWVSTKRFVFLLKVRTICALELETISYIFGFTEYDGITNTGNIDFNLKHKINNVLETSVVKKNIAGYGIVEKEMLYRYYNVTVNNTNNVIFSIRPYDIFSQLNSRMYFDYTKPFFDDISNVQMINKHMYFNEMDKRPITNNIENNIPVEYLTKIINTGLMKVSETDFFINSQTTEIDNSVPSNLNEPTLRDNYFIKTLEKLSGKIIPSNEFVFYNLMQIDSTIKDRFKVLAINKNYINPAINNTPEVGDYWHGQDALTVKAYSLIESSVAMALKFGFSLINIIATNMNNPLGLPEVFVSNFNSFINLSDNDFITLLEMFKDAYKNEIFIAESNGNKLPLHIEMYVDLLGTSKIFLNYANMGGNWYTIPTFANAEFAPVLAFDEKSLDATVDNFRFAIDNLLSMQKSHSGNNYY